MSGAPFLRPAVPLPAFSDGRAFARRLKEYLDERFPVGASLVTALLLAGAAQALASASAGAPVGLDARLLGAILVVLLALFVLRVADEHKDFGEDALAHPERALQRGVVSLDELRRLAVGAVVLLLVLAAAGGPAFLVSALATLLWLGLMRVEFFCGAFLRRHVVLYALSHQVVVPLLVFTAAAARTGELLPSIPVLLLAGVAACLGLTFEIGRKVKAPEEEVPHDETYSSAFGPRRAALLALGAAGLGALLAAVLLQELALPSPATALVALSFLLVGGAFLEFAARPRAGRGKRLLGASALHSVLVYGALLGAALAAHGIALPFGGTP